MRRLVCVLLPLLLLHFATKWYAQRVAGTFSACLMGNVYNYRHMRRAWARAKYKPHAVAKAKECVVFRFAYNASCVCICVASLFVVVHHNMSASLLTAMKITFEIPNNMAHVKRSVYGCSFRNYYWRDSGARALTLQTIAFGFRWPPPLRRSSDTTAKPISIMPTAATCVARAWRTYELCMVKMV